MAKVTKVRPVVSFDTATNEVVVRSEVTITYESGGTCPNLGVEIGRIPLSTVVENIADVDNRHAAGLDALNRADVLALLLGATFSAVRTACQSVHDRAETAARARIDALMTKV